jgi:hypothetical protein
MNNNVPLPHLPSCATRQVRAKLRGCIHLFRLWFFHVHSIADACFPFNLSRTPFHHLVGFYLMLLRLTIPYFFQYSSNTAQIPLKMRDNF